MKKTKIQKIAAQYFDRFQDLSISFPLQNEKCPGAIVVIPAFQEKNVLTTLESISKCTAPRKPIEVLILINHPENAANHIKATNETSYNECVDFSKENTLDWMTIHPLQQELPQKQAGVGYARKILMDTALQRFSAYQHDGLIINLDADCTVSPNYFVEIENAFAKQEYEAGTIHFEHELTHTDIIDYELHLRYYIQSLQWAGFPNTHHTIGSCMLCTAATYALEGGMNKRKAAEDFYFINKLAHSKKFATISSATVFPSSRKSDRVPFGTGKAMISAESNAILTYDFTIFIWLKQLIQSIEDAYPHTWSFSTLPPEVQTYILQNRLSILYAKAVQQSTNLSTFKSRFFRQFDHLKVLQFVHYCTEHFLPKVEPKKAVLDFLKSSSTRSNTTNHVDLLYTLRERDKKHEGKTE